MLRGLLGIVNVLPLRAALAIGWLIGTFFFSVLRFRRDKALARLQQGQVDPTPLIQARFPLERGLEAMERAAEPGAMKVLLDFE